MTKFKTQTGPFLKSPNTTSKIMNNVIIALIPLILFAFYKNGIVPFMKGYKDIGILLRPIIWILIPMITGFLTELIVAKIKKEPVTIKEIITNRASLLPGIFIGLIVPINTPFWLLIIAGFIASISKVISKGFGKNILNPALTGALLIIVILNSFIGSMGGYLNIYEVDTVSSATPLSHLQTLDHVGTYDTLVKPYGSLLNFFLGTIPGAIGETSALLCLVGFIYLIYKKAVKWRISITYIGTVFFMTLIIGLTNNMGIWYSLYHILSGGLFFGAIFMATDPVTSPYHPKAQIFYGILLGLLTVIIRFITPYPEGVLIAILIMNLTVPLINKLFIKINFKPQCFYALMAMPIIITVVLSLTISSNLDSPQKENITIDTSFKITDKTTQNNQTIYTISARGFAGKDAIKAKVTIQNSKITKYEIISIDDHYYNMILEKDYINTLLKNQDNLDNVDTISGATYTSKYLKDILTKTIKDYEK